MNPDEPTVEALRVHRREVGYTIVSNEIVNHRGLSWKAKGILIYMLARPPGWTPTAAKIAAAGPGGVDAAESGLLELKRLGFYRVTVLNRSGRWVSMCDLAEWPDLMPPAPTAAPSLTVTP